MLNTRANVEDKIKNKGYESIQVDGIPEGFSFKEPNITIGEIEHEGDYTAFIPNHDEQVFSSNKEDLLFIYNLELKKYGK